MGAPRSHYNLGERISRLVGCSDVLVPVGIKVRAKTQPDHRSQKRPKLTTHAAAPRLHRTRKFLYCGRRFRSADRATQFPRKKTSLKIPSPRLLNLLKQLFRICPRPHTKKSARSCRALAVVTSEHIPSPVSSRWLKCEERIGKKINAAKKVKHRLHTRFYMRWITCLPYPIAPSTLPRQGRIKAQQDHTGRGGTR